MEIRDLRYLLALFEAGTLSGAADLMCVTRQAVAKELRSLEAQVGARLFERDVGVLRPTERGNALVDDARAVVAAFDDLCDRHLAATGAGVPGGGWRVARPRELLTVAMVIGGSDALPPGLFSRFSDANPDTSLEIEEMSTDRVLELVAQGNADFGIVGSHPSLLGGFDARCLMPVGVWVIVPRDNALASRERLEPTDLEGVPMVTTGQHNHLHRFVMEGCERVGVHPDVRATSTDTELLGMMCREYGALCFGFSPELANPFPGTVVLPLDIDGGEAFGTYVIRRGGRSHGEVRSPAPARRGARNFWELVGELELRPSHGATLRHG